MGWNFKAGGLIAQGVAPTTNETRNGWVGYHRLARKQNQKFGRKPWIAATNLHACLQMALTAGFLIAIALTGRNCRAQDLPCAPTPHMASPHSNEQNVVATLEVPNSYSSSTSPAPVYVERYITAYSVPKPRVADSKFFLMNSIHLGMAVADVELTQHCIANHQCREGNPLMPSSHAGQLSIGIGYVALGSFASYRLKKRRSPYWWLPPTGGIAGHAAGIATGLSHY